MIQIPIFSLIDFAPKRSITYLVNEFLVSIQAWKEEYLDDAPEEFQRGYNLYDFWRDTAGVDDLADWFRRLTPPGIRKDTEAQRLLEAIRPFC